MTSKQKCSRGDIKRSQQIRTTYAGQKLPTPTKIKSVCVEPSKPKRQKCPENTVKRKAHEKKSYKGMTLCRPIKVKGSCVKVSKK
jgi:hypothetical protein